MVFWCETSILSTI